MNKLYISILLILIQGISNGQTWNLAKNFSYGSQSYGSNIGTDSLQNIYVTSRSFYATGGSGSYNYFMLRKFDSSGNMIWTDTLDIGNPESVCEQDGDVYISRGNKIIKYNSSGSILWTVLAASDRYFVDIALHPFGGFVVVGKIFSTPQSIISRYDENGICLWTKIGDFGPGATNLKCDALGNTYIVGSAGYPDSVSGNFGLLVKYNSSGILLYTKVVPHVQNSMTIDNSNNVYVTGWVSSIYPVNILGTVYSASISNQVQFLIKYDTLGNILWYKIISGKLGKGAIATDNNGNVYLTICYATLTIDSLSLSAPFTDSENLLVVKIDSTGAISWYRNSIANVVYAVSSPAAIHVSDIGEIYITGSMIGVQTFGSNTLTQTSSYGDLLIAKIGSDITTNITSPLSAPIKLIEFNVFPNPTKETFQIIYTSSEKVKLQLNVLNSTGKIIYSDYIPEFQGEYKKTIELSDKSKGVYFIEIIADKKRSVKKIVLN